MNSENLGLVKFEASHIWFYPSLLIKEVSVSTRFWLAPAAWKHGGPAAAEDVGLILDNACIGVAPPPRPQESLFLSELPRVEPLTESRRAEMFTENQKTFTH